MPDIDDMWDDEEDLRANAISDRRFDPSDPDLCMSCGAIIACSRDNVYCSDCDWGGECDDD